MLDEHPTSWFVVLLVGPLGGLLAAGTPDIWAQDTQQTLRTSVPLAVGDVAAIRASLRVGGIQDAVGDQVDRAIADAANSAGCLLQKQGFDRARRAVEEGDHARAATLADAMLHHGVSAECPDEQAPSTSTAERRQRALILRANAHLRADRPRRALEACEQLEADATPIPDFAWWIEARARETIDEDARAAEVYAKIYAYDDTPLKYRARARQAIALVDAGAYREALPVLDEMLDLFPDYPRRDRLLFGRARALEQLGRVHEAAAAYQETWYEFPHKPNGDRALGRLDLLKLRGVHVDAPSRHELFRRYRQLRIYRQWDLAETYFKRLLERESTPGRHSAFEHRIQMQLAINAFEPKQNEKALHYLTTLREEYRAGHRAGIHIHVVDKYLAKTYARLDRFDEALTALKRRLDRYGSYTRRRKLIEFFREHGRYEKAFQIADSSYSSWRKRRWPYGWLLYKTGRFEKATEHFERYGRARDGRSKAKGLYWAARALERDDRPDEAGELFEEVARDSPRGYYGIQAVNRLRDLRQRDAIDGFFAQQTGSVLESGDEVFAAFDDATEAMAHRRRSPRLDATMVPRVPSGDGGRPVKSTRPDACLADSPEAVDLCRLMAGEMPEDTAAILEEAISPFQLEPRDSAPAADREARTVATRGSGRPTGDLPDELVESSAETDRTTQPNRISYPTRARIYWEGRHNSQVAFARFSEGQAIGPVPKPRAYGDDSHLGGLDRAVAEAGELFPDLVRAAWLYDAGMIKHARTVARDVALEFRGLTRRPRPHDGRPHELPYERWSYLVDYRQYGQKGMWGYDGDEVLKFPRPDSVQARRDLAERQQSIWDERDDLRPLLVSALKEVGDYHLVRKFTLERGDWIHRPPTPETRDEWMQAYPRAFPREVLSASREHGINPYLIWSLMTVESAYNPDSISPADAIGLLQVIPRTGVKVATWLGDDDFGPYDLIDEDVAIEQGVSYFSSLVRKFRGQEFLAIAGYNGGPHRVAAWMDKRGAMPVDEFVEEIPFTEARAYVKKVTRFLGLYLRLYEERNALYVGQTIDGNYRHYPNF